MRSYVVKRLPHFRHSRRRRMESASLLSRESTTLSFANPQKGHFMALGTVTRLIVAGTPVAGTPSQGRQRIRPAETRAKARRELPLARSLPKASAKKAALGEPAASQPEPRRQTSQPTAEFHNWPPVRGTHGKCAAGRKWSPTANLHPLRATVSTTPACRNPSIAGL